MLSTVIRTIDVDGVPIGYTDSGDPTGRSGSPVIVFGHSLLFGGWMFRAQIDVLRRHYRCIAIDWRGQGGTQPTPDGYDMDTLTADAVGVIRELALAPVHWVGVGMGGFVGQRVAARHGELLRSLTLLDTSAGTEDPAKIGRYTRLAWAVRLFGVDAVRGKLARLLFGPAFLSDPAAADVVDEWAQRLDRIDSVGTRKAILGVVGRASADREITGISVPTLVAVGVDDTVTPIQDAQRLAALIPKARLEIIERAGHSCVLEQPTVVTTLLQTFLADLDG
ncbi:alpha/beta fold hydrolase [Nocardia altamirensis]|uniref:alpha/beta fold hydrolase n=1 Tax=Nocardia altamirensis TaxID=472158 RepID=UPI00084092FD|nr:alpha/beta fold hydrolase [Nocardia altamirensis]